MAKRIRGSNRSDPYRNFNFRLQWEGRYVAGVRRVGGLKRSTEVVEHRDGADPSVVHKAPGRTSFEAIALEIDVTHDLDFEKWASKVGNSGATAAEERKDLVIELLHESGEVVLAYQVYRAWVSEYQALPDLDANGNAVMIQTLKLENEGWERKDPA